MARRRSKKTRRNPARSKSGRFIRRNPRRVSRKGSRRRARPNGSRALIGRGARHAAKSKMLASQVAAEIFKFSKQGGKRPSWLKGSPKGVRGKIRDHLKSGKAKKSSDPGRTSRLRYSIARELQKLGYAGSARRAGQKKGRRTTFAGRLRMSKAARRAAWPSKRKGGRVVQKASKGRSTRRGKGKRAAANPGSALVPMGSLALTNSGARRNPSVSGVKNYVVGYAVPMVVAGAVGGGVHALASSFGATGKIADLVAKIPVIGEPIADNAPFTIQGLLVGGALAAAAGAVGGTAGKYLALVGGTTVVFGGAIDAFNFLMGKMEDSGDAEIDSELDRELEAAAGEGVSGIGSLAFTNGVSALGDLAFTNGVSALGDIGFGDGMAFQTAPLTAAPEYGQASLADANYSGADFSMEEGSALVNGRNAFFRRFSTPSHRIATTASDTSHLAGREGHRWGWLVKMLGWQRAAIIAALPPKKRVAAIHELRTAAIASFKAQRLQAAQATAAHQAANAPSSGVVASGAEGAPAANYLGDLAFTNSAMGDPALFVGAN